MGELSNTPCQDKAQLLEGHVPGDGPAQVARADEHALVARAQPQDVLDLLAEQGHVVAVALLAEPPKAVEVLADLGGGQAHLLRQLFGGDAGDPFVLELCEKPVVPGQPPDDGHGDVRFFLHKAFALSAG